MEIVVKSKDFIGSNRYESSYLMKLQLLLRQSLKKQAQNRMLDIYPYFIVDNL
jgi:hypothetical protein